MDVENRVRKVINEQLGIDNHDISSDDSLINDFGADSLDLLDLWSALEDEFEVEAPIADVWWDKTKTFGDLVEYVNYILAYKMEV